MPSIPPTGPVSAYRPNLVILDLNLPQVDGLSLLTAMRQGLWCRRTPVAVLTSSQASQDREEALRLGVQRFLHKAVDWDKFLALGEVFKEMLGAEQHSESEAP